MSTTPFILVVDDSRAVLFVVRTMLESCGYSNLDLIDSGTEALRRIQFRIDEGRPHAAAVLNYTMTPMTGLDVRRAMLANKAFSSIPAILMTTADVAGGLPESSLRLFSS